MITMNALCHRHPSGATPRRRSRPRCHYGRDSRRSATALALLQHDGAAGAVLGGPSSCLDEFTGRAACRGSEVVPWIWPSTALSLFVEGRSVRAAAAATGSGHRSLQVLGALHVVALNWVGGDEALTPLRRGPKVPDNLTSAALEDEIVAWRKRLPATASLGMSCTCM